MVPTSREKKLWLIRQIGQGIAWLYSSSFFVFLSNVGGNLTALFSTFSLYFQSTTFVLRAILFILLTIKNAFAPNKNAGKLAGWLLATLQLGLLGLGIFGTVLGAPIITVFFFSTLLIEVFINLVKTFYFLNKFLITKNSADKEFFRKKIKKSSLALIITSIAVCLLILIFIAAPYIGLSAVAAIAIMISLILAAAAIFCITHAIYQTFFAQPNLSEENADTAPEYTSDLALAEPSKGYYQHAVTKSVSPIQLIAAIKTQTEILQAAINAEKKWVIFSENEKRENKIKALDILTNLVEQIENNKICFNGDEIKVGAQRFSSKTAEEFQTEFNEYIIREFPDVYQSFYLSIGNTQNLFLQAYKLLNNPTYFADKKQDLPSTDNQKIEHTPTPPESAGNESLSTGKRDEF